MPTINFPTAAKQDQILSLVQSGKESSNNTLYESRSFTGAQNSTAVLNVTGKGKLYTAVAARSTNTSVNVIIILDGVTVLNFKQDSAPADTICGLVSSYTTFHTGTTVYPFTPSRTGTSTPITSAYNWILTTLGQSQKTSEASYSIVHYIPTYLTFNTSARVILTTSDSARMGIMYSID